ncbi:GYD domain-containing protein [Candidatus Lucifugimonas marina]|jgi:uncharacterized protein with GYD domain|uniref:GYD domain-containing protein n=1 Tax=Candidatus Lucifugimonas marina TaxID=3038979 RepID=A0AAJ5ZL76_9CHLR|nr:GYD domain-containing protein [SAR202 cluster bacterium JH702]MDG0869318.1 GYD domain-containing protein [SAR202 cluster bacterium JH639]WFG40652.1 GYD domain-containing protein [SAR202 cluster bacterium JH1073]
MPKYVTLFNFTSQGITEVKTSPGRMKAAKEGIEALGGTMTEFLVTMGRYDGVVSYELPDDETAAMFLLKTGALGFVSTETMRAFDVDEFEGITDKI